MKPTGGSGTRWSSRTRSCSGRRMSTGGRTRCRFASPSTTSRPSTTGTTPTRFRREREIPADLAGACPAYDIPSRDAEGEYLVRYVYAQDVLAWETQGRIMERQSEHLASHDRGVTMYRNMLKREIKKVQAGEDPMWVLRDPERNRCIEFPHELRKAVNAAGLRGPRHAQHGRPDADGPASDRHLSEHQAGLSVKRRPRASSRKAGRRSRCRRSCRS